MPWRMGAVWPPRLHAPPEPCGTAAPVEGESRSGGPPKTPLRDPVGRGRACGWRIEPAMRTVTFRGGGGGAGDSCTETCMAQELRALGICMHRAHGQGTCIAHPSSFTDQWELKLGPP